MHTLLSITKNLDLADLDPDFRGSLLSLKHEKGFYLQSILQTYHDLSDQIKELNLVERYMKSRESLDSLRLCEHSQNRICSVFNYQLESFKKLNKDNERNLEIVTGNGMKNAYAFHFSKADLSAHAIESTIKDLSLQFQCRFNKEKDLVYRKDYI